MRLLDRYLFRELLIPLGYCLGGFLIFWISFDLFSELGEFQSKKLKGVDVLEYYFVKMPDLLSIVLPVALLLALLYALTTHARHNELTAMRAAGVSLWRLSLPYLALGFLFSLLLFCVNEWWASDAADRAEDILHRYESREGTIAREWRRNFHFKNDGHKRHWSSSAYNLETSEMIRPIVNWEVTNSVIRVLNADRAVYTNDVWTFYNVTDSLMFPDVLKNVRSQTNVLALPEFAETPETIRSEIKINNLNFAQAAKRPQLSLQEISDYLHLHPGVADSKADMLKTQWHARLASPWTCLVVVLIAIPFGAPSGRRNVFVGVAASIFICFAYFFLLRMGLTLGTGGYLPGWLAAWLPNVLFGGTGIFLTTRVR